MEKKIIHTLNNYIEYLESVEKNQRARFESLNEYEGMHLKMLRRPSGKVYYYSRCACSTRFRYLGDSNCEDVDLIKEVHYYNKSLERIDSNLEICRKTLNRLERTDYDSINEALPRVYRGAALQYGLNAVTNASALEWKRNAEMYKAGFGPWYPEGLKDRTEDGSMVRSKSEALIYNKYFHVGSAFVYELPLVLPGNIVLHPDFTVLSEIDFYTEIRQEHQGRYGFEKDRLDYDRKSYLYWKNGFIPGINIFYTFDDPRGGFDISVVDDIIKTRIRPC